MPSTFKLRGKVAVISGVDCAGVRNHLLVHMQNDPKKLIFLPPDMYTYVCILGNIKC